MINISYPYSMADSNPNFAIPESQATCDTAVEKPLAGDVRFNLIIIFLKLCFLQSLGPVVCLRRCAIIFVLYDGPCVLRFPR